MTVGERIQFYRKEIGLSQEDLGAKLLVSRQTVSLWEMDKTMPTVDNLVRLKEIFGVSVDELLGCQPCPPTEEEIPREIYRITYTTAEMDEVYKLHRNRAIKNWLQSIVPIVGLLCVVIFLESAFAFGFCLSILLLSCYMFFGHLRTTNKQWRSNGPYVYESTFEYNIFDDHLTVTIFRDGAKHSETRYTFSDISGIEDVGQLYMLILSGQLFFLRKSDLREDSFFRSFRGVQQPLVEKNPPKNPLKGISIALFVASIVAIFGAMTGVSLLTGRELQSMTGNMWVFFLFTPIPIASVIFGFWQKKRGVKYKKNVVVGFIMTALLCIYGSFCFIGADTYTYGNDPILRVEQVMGVDLPEPSGVYTENRISEGTLLSKGKIHSISYIYFDKEVALEYEAQLRADEGWMSSVPNDLAGIIAYRFFVSEFGYCLVYNMNTEEWNTQPEKSGTYSFLALLYNEKLDMMILVEYELEYSEEYRR